MKVKTMIEFLQKQNPEHYVGRYECGQDSGDLINIRDDELVIMEKPDEWYAEYGENCKKTK